MRNRVYHVDLNRFLQADPIGFKGDALNLYRYCRNDPVNKTDPTGLYVEYNKGNESFWKDWRNQFEKRWQDPAFRDWWNRAASLRDAAYVVGPKNERVPTRWKSNGYPENPQLPRTMPRATDGSVASQRGREIINKGQAKGTNITHFGYPGDKTPDNNSKLGLGSGDNILNPDSVALLRENTRGLPFGAPVEVNGHFIGYYHDLTSPRLRNGPRVDVYDPSNSF